MFDSLQTRLEAAFNKIRGRGSLTEKDVTETLKEVRVALLEADVNFKVAKDFCQQVETKAVGEAVLKSLSPAQQVIKLVHETLVEMMGAESTALELNVAPPAVIMLVGLQGSGKTTTAGKLARYLKKEVRRNPLLVPADVYRAAAIDQLKTLGAQADVAVFDSSSDQEPLTIVRSAIEYAKTRGYDTVIIDTAGRLQIDSELMAELQEISDAVSPHEILLVADAMTGQEAVNVAQGFDKALEIDGLILTKFDGDARGGAALSMRAVTGKTDKVYRGRRKLDGIEVFHPERIASRILGMGDVLTLIEKASKQVSMDDALELQKKFKKNTFDLQDFLNQMKVIRGMGSISSLAGMIPGMDKFTKQIDPEKAEKEMKKVEAIILSMTPKERRTPEILNGSRRKRIAKGSGTRVEDVNVLLKQFNEMKKMMGQLSKMGMGGLMNMMGGGMKGLGNLGGLFSPMTFYVTTPIYYVNDAPHIGHAYTTIVADVLYRYHKLFGDSSYFLTGTDEHGQKVQQSAEKRGKTPLEHCNELSLRFQETWKSLEVSNDIFMRTTFPFHMKVVQECLTELYEKGEIYSHEYEGWYSVSEEIFYTEKDLVDGKSPTGKEVTKITEKNYFFKMSKYQNALIEYIDKNPTFIQPEGKSEVLGFLKQPLQDLCISRPKARLSWGIEIPFDTDFVTYVWFDALLNYCSAIGLKQGEEKEKNFHHFWPHTVHLIGKDILLTHTVYWTTMLMALGLPQPAQIFAHGWWLNDDGAKMAKSEGKVTSPLEMKDLVGVDPFRYFLIRETALGNDAAFSPTIVVSRVNSELSNNFGNLLSRVTALLEKYYEGKIPGSKGLIPESEPLKNLALETPEKVKELILKMSPQEAVGCVIELLTATNRYIDTLAPWKLVKEDLEKQGNV